MKILIADDEKLVRFSLKSMLEEIGVPAASIHVAVDGEELVDKARRLRPDIALVDIRMPKLNGLEAIEKVAALTPGTHWVVLTSYSVFDYARKAVGLGASEYLLKPVSPRELAAVIERLGLRRQDEHRRTNEEFEGQVNALLHDTLTLRGADLEFLEAAVFLAVQLHFDSVLPEERLQEAKLSACRVVRDRFSAAAGSGARLALCALPDGRLVALGAWRVRGPDVQAYAETVRGVLRRAHGLVQQGLPPRFVVTCLQGEECPSFELLREQLGELRALAVLRPVLGVGRCIPLSELRRRGAQESACRFGAILLQMADSFRRGNLLEFLRQVDALRGLGALSELLRPAPPREFVRLVLGFGPAGVQTSQAWLEAMADWGRRELAQRGGASDPVARAIDYLSENYARSAGLAEIARRLSLTPNYLSSLFHRRTGLTFHEYLRRLRLEQAAALLARPGARIQEVARQVGYGGSRHFSRLFRQKYGCLPSQYTPNGSSGATEP